MHAKAPVPWRQRQVATLLLISGRRPSEGFESFRQCAPFLLSCQSCSSKLTPG